MHEPLHLIDTHAHVHCPHFDVDRAAILERASAAHVECIIEVGYDLASSRIAIQLAEQHAHIFAVVGIQPNHVHEAPQHWREEVHRLATHPKVVAIGEIGLDYYRNYAPHQMQQAFFVDQLALAHELGLPVVIHSREAQHDTIRLLRAHAVGQARVMHSFSGNWEFATACLDVGCMLSFSGPVTFPKASDLHDVVRRIPIDRILTETDCPYLTPHPFRGKRNEPAYVRFIVERLAELRGESLEEVASAVRTNAFRVFW